MDKIMEHKKKPSKILKVLAFLTALIMIAGLVVFSTALIGNPVSKWLSEKEAKRYIAEHYPNTDYYVENVVFSFKDNCYYSRVKSPSSEDSSFSLIQEMDGEVRFDYYESRVLYRGNTADRIYMEYRALVDSVIESPSYPYIADICFGDLRIGDYNEVIPDEAAQYITFPDKGIDYTELELDKVYDIPKLGAEYGHLVLDICDETVTVERAAEILLETKRLLDEGGVPFATVDFELKYPRPEDNNTPRKEGEIRALYFRAEDIYEEGMVERLREANENAIAYYAALDAERAK